MERDASERLAILVVDGQGELLAHARTEFLSARVVRVGTTTAARCALHQVRFDVILCRQTDVRELPDDERVVPVDRPLSADQVLSVFANAVSRRARWKRTPNRTVRSCGCCQVAAHVLEPAA